MNDPFAGLKFHPAAVVHRRGSLPAELGAQTRARLSAVLERCEGGVPVAPSVLPFEIGAAVRPAGHRRCYYVRLGDDPRGEHVAVKGTEVVLLEQQRALMRSGLHRARMNAHALRAIDYFPIHEHKAPMLLLAGEARDDAQIASAVHAAYGARYGELAALPLPLGAFQWPQDVVDAYWRLTGPELSPWAREITERLIAGGAGAYVYYYPAPPFPRVRHVAAALRGRGAGFDRAAALAAHGEPAAVVQNWVRLFVRLLALGYLPCTESQLRTGQAVQAQNAVVGAGFVDVDSIRAISTLADDAELASGYLLGLRVLASTLAVYLFGEQPETDGVGGPYAACLGFLYDAVARAAADDARCHGDTFDPRLRALPPFRADAAALLELARMHQRQPSQDDMERALDRH